MLRYLSQALIGMPSSISFFKSYLEELEEQAEGEFLLLFSNSTVFLLTSD